MLFCHLLILSLSVIAGCDNGEQHIKIDNSHALLEMLRIGDHDISPTFEITQKHYVSTTDFSVTEISLQAWTKNQSDSVSVNGQLLSGRGNFNLAVGNNSFSILVTNNQGITEHYQLTVTRLPESVTRN